MPRRKTPSWRAIKSHRSYTVDEAARALGLTKGTVRRWIRNGQLPALTDKRPHLIRGEDLKDFLKARKAPKAKCRPDELYCVKCRAPRIPKDRQVQISASNNTSGNLHGLCPVCGTRMHKHVSLARLPELRKHLRILPPGAGDGEKSTAYLDQHRRQSETAINPKNSGYALTPAPQAEKRLCQSPIPCLNDNFEEE